MISKCGRHFRQVPHGAGDITCLPLKALPTLGMAGLASRSNYNPTVKS